MNLSIFNILQLELIKAIVAKENSNNYFIKENRNFKVWKMDLNYFENK